MNMAEQQVIAVAQMGEPEHIINGMLLMGDAYLILHDDMTAAPPPRSLNQTQVEMYQSEVTRHAAILRTKAEKYYIEGRKLAQRIDWQGRSREELENRLGSM